MIDPKKQRYVHYYNASAMALGGKITRPFEAILETQAPSVLPIDGGFGSSRVENFRFKEIISFKTAYSVVTGSQSETDGSFATMASVTIEDLNILDVVTAKKIVSRISTHHPIPKIVEGKDLDPSPGPQIVALGKFEDLCVNGYELDVELDANLSCECTTYDAYKKNCGDGVTESKGMIVRSLVKNIFKKCPGGQETLKSYNAPANQRPPAADVVAKFPCHELNPTLPSAENKFSCSLEIQHFGKIHLAQFLCSSSARRLVMLRVELGCPAAGTVTVGCAQGNGSTIP
jgi:hypothetical protein